MIAVGVSTLSGSTAQTDVYASYSLGANNTWVSVTGSTPLSGGGVGLTISPCGILVTTLTSAHLVVTTFPFNCHSFPSANPSSGEEEGVLPPSGGPSVTSVLPNYGGPGTLVTIDGLGFTDSSLNVYFEYGSTKWNGESVKYLGATQIVAYSPSGPPTGTAIDVVISDSSGTSSKGPSDEYFYPAYPAPTVTGIVPTTGPIGTVVNITGTNFLNESQVVFGSLAASSVAFVTADSLQAVAPYQSPSSYVNVRVITLGGESATSSADRYTYTSGTRPGITSIWPTWGAAGTRVQINGSNFISTATVTFGGLASTGVTFVSPTELTAVSPSGTGTVNVLVNSTGLQSGPILSDLFSYPAPLPGNFVRTTTNLAEAVSADPVWTTSAGGPNGTLGVFATSSSSSKFVVYISSNEWTSHTTTTLAPVNLTSGSPYFTSLGQTELQTPGGTPGLVTAVAEGAYFIGFVTDQEQNRTVLRSVGSSNAGSTWGPSYITGASMGSFVTVEASASPAGYVYVAAADTGAGSTELEQIVFSVTGRMLSPPEPFPATTNLSGPSPSSVSVTVDPLERPLFAWGAQNYSTNGSGVYLSGNYPSPLGALINLKQAFDASTTTDFQPVSTSKITAYRNQIDANLSTAWSDLNGSLVCAAERVLTTSVYPRLSTLSVHPVYQIQQGCSSVIGSGVSYVAPFDGALNANTTFSVMGEALLEAFGFGVFPNPPWLGSPMSGLFAVTALSGGVNVPIGTSGGATSLKYPGDWLTVTPQPVNPNSVFLNDTASFKSSYSTDLLQPCVLPGHPVGQSTRFRGTDNYTYIALYGEVASWNSNSTHAYYTSSSPGSFYLTNLTPSQYSTGTWSFWITAYYSQTDVVYACSQSTPLSKTSATVNNGPSAVTLQANGTYATALGSDPASPIIHLSQAGSNYVLNASWNNTMYANGTAQYVDTGFGGGITGFPGYLQKNPALDEAISNTTTRDGNYELFVNLTSEKGGRNATWTPILNTGQQSSIASPVTVEATCSFTISATPQISLTVPTVFATNVTATDATLKWFANGNGTGWVRLHEAYGPPYQQTGWEKYNSTQGAYEYQVELHGLTPWGLYYVEFGVSVVDGSSTCAMYDGTSSGSFSTANVPQLAQTTSPYDSITKEGGGVQVYFNLPQNIIQHGSGFSLFVQYYNVSLPNNMTNLPLSSGEFSQAGPGISFNLSALVPNTTYAVLLDFNYTYSSHSYTARNSTFQFYYLRDTSGDGLSDAEKVQGWEVSWQALNGTYINRIDTADPSTYATNGLVSDYLEKEYGLNPRTLDTSTSHMLDTYNLTFDLGPSGVLPNSSLFHYFLENSTYNFNSSSSCQVYTPPGSSCLAPHRGYLLESNITATGRLNPGDSTPWASTVRWNSTGKGSALSEFETLMQSEGVSWLRATTGFYGSDRTITVWGKLSWGADPLAQSTSKDGVVDGASTDPLGTPFVTLNLTGWNVSTGLASGDGVAPYLYAYSGSGSGKTVDYSAWGPNVTSSSTATAPGAFVVTVPVVPTDQYVSLNISIAVNHSASGGPFNHPVSTGIYLLDLTGNQSNQRKTFSNSSGNLQFNYTIVGNPGKANTYLWIPANNTTLSNAPWGLKRYTAEQDFDLLVVNNTGTQFKTSGVPGAETGWSYNVTLKPGLNNILVPREAFLGSPLGQTLLNGSAVSPKTLTSGTTFTSSYWFWRVDQAMTSNTSANFIHVYSSTSQSANGSTSSLFAGLSTNPSLESSYKSLQVQSVIWINISSGNSGNFSNGASELKNLIGGLIQNLSGNLTGNLVPMTYELAPLGLSPNVLVALANATLPNGGQYGPPLFTVQSHGGGEPWWDVGALIQNAISGVVSVGGRLVSAVWSVTSAAAAYVANAAVNFANKLGITALVDQVGSALKALGQAMWYALRAFLNFLVSILDQILSPLASVIESTIGGYLSAVNSTLNAIYVDEGGHLPSTSSDVTSFWQSLSGNVFLTALILGTVVTACLTITEPFDVGPEFLISVVAGLLAIGLLGLGALPQISALTTSAIQTLETFITSIPGVGSYLKQPVVYSTLSAAVAGTSAAALYPAWEVMKSVSNNYPIIGITLFAVALLAFLFDVWGEFNESPLLLILALGFSAITAEVALKSLKGSGATLAGYLEDVGVAGGISAVIDLTKIILYV
ncbi:MAG: IPT/TIG domain-containing protein [Thermoplasmata archaeon]|jgi:hypothetical protein